MYNSPNAGTYFWDSLHECEQSVKDKAGLPNFFITMGDFNSNFNSQDPCIQDFADYRAHSLAQLFKIKLD